MVAAADAISSKSGRPSMSGVRDQLGTGSMGTIQRHLAAWQAGRWQHVATMTSLSPELQRMMLADIEAGRHPQDRPDDCGGRPDKPAQ